ncbi:MAG: hypothetical protein F6K47_31025 [Symploca sp. SIO2E6]|nr:hypothetical protein [Symploca sp. SIO2E6]
MADPILVAVNDPSPGYYEVIIATGEENADKDNGVSISLVEEGGNQSNSVQLGGGLLADHYERGGVDTFSPVEFNIGSLDKVKQVKVDYTGRKWRLNGIWITDRTSGIAGETLYATPNILLGSNGETSSQEFDLESTYTEICGAKGTNTYEKFKVTVATADKFDAGTNQPVFIKLFDMCGKSSEVKQPASSDFDLNNWQAGKTDNFTIPVTPPLTDITEILLYKTGSDKWIPTQVTAAGMVTNNMSGLPQVKGDVSAFTINKDLSKDDCFWDFCSTDGCTPGSQNYCN